MKAVPAFLRRHPALWAEWLRLANYLSRWRGEGRNLFWLVSSALAVVAALLVALWGHVAVGVRTLADYWVMLAVVAAFYAAMSVSGRRRQLEETTSQSWLVATPILPRDLLVSQIVRVLLPLVVLAVAVVMFLIAVALTTDGVAITVRTVAAATVGGLFIGGVVGWFTGRRAKPSGVVPSRYVPKPRLRRSVPALSRGTPSAEATHTEGTDTGSTAEATTAVTGARIAGVGMSATFEAARTAVADVRPDAAGLSGWPIAQVFAWSRPENSRYVLIAALLAVQGGSSALTGLSVIAMYLLGSYLAALLSAMTTVAKLAADWLRAAPITLVGFVWSLSRRALAHQLIGVALAVGCMSLLGAPVDMAMTLAALWLGLFVSISGFALIDRYRGRSPLVKVALTAAAFAAVATILQLRAGAKT